MLKTVDVAASNPFFSLKYERALESLEEEDNEYFEETTAATFPRHILRFRNDSLLLKLGLDPQEVTDEDFIIAFGKFQGRQPFLALGYHGHQFGRYNQELGDGRGFLYGQVRGTDGKLYDLGTKGSGKTPYSIRKSTKPDGKLTLKGGIREVLIAEALHYLGVNTSRCLSLIETGEELWRDDEPSPTKSSVMVRLNHSHIRFGTFERLHYFKRPDLIKRLLDHVIEYYYPKIKDIKDERERYEQFYDELVERTARLVAQWMSVGFCHAILNTDNMSIVGESFDYGPSGFITEYDPDFTAADLDKFGLYSYGNQPRICRFNLQLLQFCLVMFLPLQSMEYSLNKFDEHYRQIYRHRMLNKLGLENVPILLGEELLNATIKILKNTRIGYHDFFIEIANNFSLTWVKEPRNILENNFLFKDERQNQYLDKWQSVYHQVLSTLPEREIRQTQQRLERYNPKTVLLKSKIDAVWEKILNDDDWISFDNLLKSIGFVAKTGTN